MDQVFSKKFMLEPQLNSSSKPETTFARTEPQVEITSRSKSSKGLPKLRKSRLLLLKKVLKLLKEKKEKPLLPKRSQLRPREKSSHVRSSITTMELTRSHTPAWRREK